LVKLFCQESDTGTAIRHQRCSEPNMEIANDVWTRCAALAYRYPAADHPLTCTILAVMRAKNSKGLYHGGALPSAENRVRKFSFKKLPTQDAQGIHDFIAQADIVEGPDELWELVAGLWPELLPKLKPPRALMH
jgi:hypothetical protein